MAKTEGLRLKEFLRHEKITQSSLAVTFGIPQSYISRYCTGKLRIPNDLIKFLHNRHNLSYKWFYHKEGSMVDKEKKSRLFDFQSLSDEVELLKVKIERLEADIKILSKK